MLLPHPLLCVPRRQADAGSAVARLRCRSVADWWSLRLAARPQSSPGFFFLDSLTAPHHLHDWSRAAFIMSSCQKKKSTETAERAGTRSATVHVNQSSQQSVACLVFFCLARMLQFVLGRSAALESKRRSWWTERACRCPSFQYLLWSVHPVPFWNECLVSKVSQGRKEARASF